MVLMCKLKASAAEVHKAFMVEKSRVTNLPKHFNSPASLTVDTSKIHVKLHLGVGVWEC